MPTTTKRKPKGAGRRRSPGARGEPITAEDRAVERMAIAGEKKARGRKPAAGKRNERLDPINLARAPGRLERLNVGVNLIDPSPFQPRASSPQEELRELAESMARQGQVQPVLLRPGKKKGRYELVDGERRWRAAKLAGLPAVRAEVGDFTDTDARQVILTSALQRKDLSPIEEARAFKAALAAGDAPGPTELARQLGLSQGHVSNRLRLLELPKDVQAKVISQEIPATHARELARLKDHPELVSAIAQDFVHDAQYDAMPTVEAFREELVCDVERHAIRLDGEEYDGQTGRRVPRFTPTPEQRAELSIVSLEETNYRGKPETVEFATNQAAWKKMQAAYRKKWLKEHPAGKDGTKRGGAKPPKKPKKLTPAQEKARAAEQARIYARRLWEWYSNWMRWLCREWIVDAGLSAMEDLHYLLLYFAASRRTWHNLTDCFGRDEQLCHILRSRQVKVTVRAGRGADLAGALGQIGGEDLEGITRGWLAAMFWDGSTPAGIVQNEDAVTLAKFLRVSPETAWLEDQAGPLSLAYWNLHNKDQLVELAKELKVSEIKPAMKKAAMVKVFLSKRPKPDAKEVGLNLPKELKKIKRIG